MQIEFYYNGIAFIVLACFAMMLLIQLVYLWAVYARVAFYRRKETPKHSEALEPISVVVCSRDNYQSLSELLPALLRQDYPDFEIVVVNDCSQDETELYLKEMELRDPRIKPVHLRQHLNFFSGKKIPLSMGIKSAQHDLLVFTEPGSLPVDDHWLRSIADGYHDHTEVLIGYSPYRPQNNLLNHLVRFDALYGGIQYLSAALSGHPFMGLGSHLSYRKGLFYRNKGFTSHYSIPVGDDDLFVNQVAKRNNTSVFIDAEHTVVTVPPASFGLWMRNKARRYYSATLYKARDRRRMTLQAGSHFLLYACFIALLLLSPAFTIVGAEVLYLPIIAVLFLLYYASQMVVFGGAAKRLGEKGLLPGLVFYDLFQALMTPLFRLLGRFRLGVKR